MLCRRMLTSSLMDCPPSSQSKQIQDLPEEILEYILSYVSPYEGLKACMQVCKKWQKCVQRTVQHLQRQFEVGLQLQNIIWLHMQPSNNIPGMSERYSHASCVHGGHMYVFGGCTSSSTTFNDLWKLNLSTRVWCRPLAVGTYPPPKASVSMVAYQDSLLAFGGWTHPSPYPLHQVWTLHNSLHVYNVNENLWTEAIFSQATTDLPAHVAGHSATVHGSYMVVFGGLQRHSHTIPHTSSNALWVLDVPKLTWCFPRTSQIKPTPRYGQTQIRINDRYLLIIAGCGGANRIYCDIWLLDMCKDPPDLGLTWTWREMKVKNPENAPSHIWCNPGCKVGEKVVVLGKSRQSTSPGPTFSADWNLLNIKIHRPSHSHNSGSSGDSDIFVNGRHGQFRSRGNARLQEASHDSDSSTNGSQSSSCSLKASDHPTVHDEGNNLPQGQSMKHCSRGIDNIEAVPSSSSHRPRNFPSVCPNASCDRQRQLESLRKMEERIRRETPHKSASSFWSTPPIHKLCRTKIPSRRMCMYLLDISAAVSEGWVSWMALKHDEDAQGPEETILYSLVRGRGELVMFGGIQKDANSIEKDTTSLHDVVKSDNLSNQLHFITLPASTV